MVLKDLKGGEREGPLMDGRILWYMYSGLFYIELYLFIQLVFTWMIGRWFVLAGLMLTPDNIEICLAQMHTQKVHIDSIHKNRTESVSCAIDSKPCQQTSPLTIDHGLV